MKKRAFALIICIATLLAMLCACGEVSNSGNDKTISSTDSTMDNRGESSQTVVFDNRNINSNASDGDSPAKITVSDKDFEVIDYLYEDSLSSRYFLIITNNSEATVSIFANGIAKDANGSMIGASDLSIDVLGPGETSIGYFYFNGVSGIETVEYEMTYDTEPYYTPILSNLYTEQTINNKNVIVAVTNNGEIPAYFVEAYALFFDAENNVVDYTSRYITDDDIEIKAGKTIVAQLDTYESFDHVEVYLTGRGI